MDFSAHTTPYILIAYGVSFVAIAGLIVWRMARLKKAQSDEKAAKG
ncbi:heme exporter protein CcmD [Hyphococcus sp.]